MAAEASLKKVLHTLIQSVFRVSLRWARVSVCIAVSNPTTALWPSVTVLGSGLSQTGPHGTRGPEAPWPRGPVSHKVPKRRPLTHGTGERIFTNAYRALSDRIGARPRTTMDAEETLQQRRRRLGQVARAVGSQHVIIRRLAASG